MERVHKHSTHEEYAPGLWRIARPLRAPLDVRVRCDHRWHPADGMIAWFCCRCGGERDGMPKDGRGLLGRVLVRWSRRHAYQDGYRAGRRDELEAAIEGSGDLATDAVAAPSPEAGE